MRTGPEDVDLKGQALTVATQLVDINGEIEENAPKSDAGNRLVALDGGTVKVIKRHNKRQRQAREEAGAAWVDSGRLFTRPNGEWVEPTWLSDYFDRLVKRLGLPPIRLHDLRHGAATMALKAGAKMKVVQEMLGHSSYALTADTYTAVLPELAMEAAEATARLISGRGTKRTPGLTSGSQGGKASKDATKKDRKRGKKQQVKPAA